jgi:hypothetical protein
MTRARSADGATPLRRKAESIVVFHQTAPLCNTGRNLYQDSTNDDADADAIVDRASDICDVIAGLSNIYHLLAPDRDLSRGKSGGGSKQQLNRKM